VGKSERLFQFESSGDLMSTTLLLIAHGLLAVALLGAVTHQAVSVWLPMHEPANSFVGRVRGVSAASYVNAIIILYVSTAILGGVFIYPEYRLSVRIVLEQMRLRVPVGIFDLKEHFVTVGLGILPAYWYFWRQPLADDHFRTRALLTATLAFIVWWSFLVGHILNNMRGFGL
jgi:hypothetical protein